MSGLMNNYMYGKAGQADFTPEQLPANRVQLFFSMLKIRFSGLIGMNLLYLLFALPMIAWTFLNILATSGNVYNEAGEIIDTVVLTTEELLGYVNVYLMGLVPCMMVLSIGIVGITYVLRNWARDQHSFVLSDFKDAIKNNWKQALILGLINGVAPWIAFTCYRYYGLMSANSVVWVIPQTLVVCIFVLWCLINMLIFPMMVTYDMKFKTLIRNSFIMGLARLPFTLLIGIVPIAVPVVIAIFVPFGWIAALIFYALIGLAGTMFIQISYANACFDRFLNPRIEGAEVNRGLRDPQYDDDDDEDDADPTLI